MTRRRTLGFTLVFVALASGSACKQRAEDRPPPDARRPELRSQSELAAEREQRIASGEVMPTSAPVVQAERRPIATPRRLPPAARASAGAIQSDILMVNDAVLSADEILFPLRKWILEKREELTPAGFIENLTRIAREQIRREIGSLLVYQEAAATIDDQRREAVDRAVKDEMARIVARDYGGSTARLERELADYSLTLDLFRKRLERDMVVSQYMREKLEPRLYVRRDELLDFYRERAESYCAPETRELLMIEAPYEKFLPEGQTWTRASSQEKAQARLAAVRHIRAARSALASKPFDEVAREYSKAPQVETGGSWGQIGKPLQAPYDKLSERIFSSSQGQASEPIETERGWFIVGCGKIEPAKNPTFAEVQQDVRRELKEHKYTELSNEYILRLAEKSTISAFDAFLSATVRRANSPNWPQKRVAQG